MNTPIKTLATHTGMILQYVYFCEIHSRMLLSGTAGLLGTYRAEKSDNVQCRVSVVDIPCCVAVSGAVLLRKFGLIFTDWDAEYFGTVMFTSL